MALSGALSVTGPQRIGVFRALMLGDMLCATPALRALRRAWPEARLALAALPWAREFALRLPSVDDFIAFPGLDGLPESVPDRAALPGFVAAMRDARFDLLVQLHGDGRVVNPLVADCGARRTAGFVRRGHAAVVDPQLHVEWPESGHEIERLLAVVDRLGVARAGQAIDFPLRRADHEALRAAWPDHARGSHVCLHAGARLASRRWPASRFAAVGDALAACGWRVVLTGSPAERELVDAVARAMRRPAVNLAGRTTLWTLGALIESAQLLVCNDTGVSHVAAATGTPSVVIACGSDAARWSPPDARRHAVLWHSAACRPCAHETCPYAHECASGITVETVIEAAFAALAGASSKEQRRVPV